MEKLVSGQSGSLLKKGRKKAAKDELDRLKQAEKKKRRLEKALATSAAICSQLEKKKQKRKEEEEQQQQRLDDEGAAIAEAVALHVLVGEDTDDSCHFMLNNNRRYNPSDHSGDIGLFMSYHKLASMDSTQAKGRAAHGSGSGCEWNDWEIDQSVPPSVHVRDFQSPFYDRYRGDNLSAGIIAAQAVSSLQIAEDLQENLFSGRGAATVVINQMMGGSSNMSDGLKSL